MTYTFFPSPQDTTETFHLHDARASEELESADLSNVQLVYGSAFFKGLATGGNVSKAMDVAGERAAYTSVVAFTNQILMLGEGQLSTAVVINCNRPFILYPTIFLHARLRATAHGTYLPYVANAGKWKLKMRKHSNINFAYFMPHFVFPVCAVPGRTSFHVLLVRSWSERLDHLVKENRFVEAINLASEFYTDHSKALVGLKGAWADEIKSGRLFSRKLFRLHLKPAS